MTIAIDARMKNKSGIGTYIRNLMARIRYDVVLDESNFPCKNYGIREQLFFPYGKLRKEKVDVLHVPHLNIPAFYRGQLVVTIHDLTHLRYPRFLPNMLYYFYFKFMIGLAVKKARVVLTDSQNTKKDIMEFFDVEPDKIKVIYLGVGKEFVIRPTEEVSYLREKYNIPKEKKVLLYAGNLLPHKNVKTLLKAFDLIDGCALILVGKSFKNRSEPNYEPTSVIYAGEVSQNELVDLYNLADLFVLPSLYEGFGLPVLESMACGTPVACSNVSSLPEVGGEHAFYFDPEDENNIADTINKALAWNGDKSALREYALRFSWEKTAEETLNEITSAIPPPPQYIVYNILLYIRYSIPLLLYIRNKSGDSGSRSGYIPYSLRFAARFGSCKKYDKKQNSTLCRQCRPLRYNRHNRKFINVYDCKAELHEYNAHKQKREG
jgi:glycosyltransferase involved in cell wall biosynthesis